MKFRKKPVVIEAFLIPPISAPASHEDLPPWLVDAIATGNVVPLPAGGVDIITREGIMRGNVGDWLIQGVKGELYPCKPDIFAATYEHANNG